MFRKTIVSTLIILSVILSSVPVSVPVMGMEIEETEDFGVSADITEETIEIPYEDTAELDISEEVIDNTDVSAEPERETVSENTASGNGVDYILGYEVMPWDNDVKMSDKEISFADIKAEGEARIASTDFGKAEIPSAFPSKATDMDAIKDYLAKYPAVRNQGDFGTCWVHSVMSASEFSQVKKAHADNSVDYSEMYLAYRTYKDVENPIIGDGDEGKVWNYMTDKQMLKTGGNLKYAAQFLSKGYGYVKENDMPYHDSRETVFDNQDNVVDAERISSDLYKKDVARLENLYITNINTDNGKKLIKQAVVENGGVSAAFNMSTGNDVYNDATSSFYHKDFAVHNHAIAIVGFDDDYSVDNFSTRPSKPGAWLVRNSWGYDSADTFSVWNYFWVSYEDKSFEDAAYIFDLTEDTSAYDNNYFYDTQIHNCVTKSAGAYANVFTVQDKGDELLTEVMVEIGAPTDYTVDVYTNLTLDNCPTSGLHELECKTEGRFELPGIYTVPLKTPVTLKKGTKFAVIVNTNSDAIVQEQGYSANSSGGKSYAIDCGLREGQSFKLTKYNNKWEDLKTQFAGGGNICISAHTKNAGELPEAGEEKIELTFNDELGNSVPVLYSKKYHTYEDKDGNILLVFSGTDDVVYDSQLLQYTGKKQTPGKKKIIYNNVVYNAKRNFSIKYKYTKGVKPKNAGASCVASVKWKKSMKKAEGIKDADAAFYVVPREVEQNDYDKGNVITKIKNGKPKSIKIRAGKEYVKAGKKEYTTTASSNGISINFSSDNLKGSFVAK